MSHIKLHNDINSVNGICKLDVDGTRYWVHLTDMTFDRSSGESCADIRFSGEFIRAMDAVIGLGKSTSKTLNPFKIDRVIFNGPATIVFWADGTKTVAKCSPNDTFSKETGLAMAIAKKTLGDDFSKVFKKFAPEVKKNETTTRDNRGKTSEWVKDGASDRSGLPAFKCAECGGYLSVFSNPTSYCPHCGAKMKNSSRGK